MKGCETVIVGGGPGGYVAAIRASQLGQKVTLIERNVIGGTCLNVGCIPTKALLHTGHSLVSLKTMNRIGLSANGLLDYAKTQAWKETQVINKLRLGILSLLKKVDVEILKGEALFTSPSTLIVKTDAEELELSFDHAIIATGSRPIELKAFPFSSRILDSTGLLDLKTIPSSLAILGSGYIGTEMAEAFSALGSKVTLIEALPTILPAFDPELSGLVSRSLQKAGVSIHCATVAKSVTENAQGVDITVMKDQETHIISADYLMVSVGRRPNTDHLGCDLAQVELEKNGWIRVNEALQSTNPRIYAIGDVIAGPALAHKASAQAKQAAEIISGHLKTIIPQTIPSVLYTSPEIACAGLTLEEALQQGINAKASKFAMAANSKAVSSVKAEGFVTLVFESDCHRLIGAQIASEAASELISLCTLCIDKALTLEDITRLIFPHPSLSEALLEAAEQGLA